MSNFKTSFKYCSSIDFMSLCSSSYETYCIALRTLFKNSFFLPVNVNLPLWNAPQIFNQVIGNQADHSIKSVIEIHFTHIFISFLRQMWWSFVLHEKLSFSENLTSWTIALHVALKKEKKNYDRYRRCNNIIV